MAKVNLYKSGIVNDVKAAVKKLYNLMNEELKYISGEIWIIPSVDIIVGTGTEDLDILLMGYLEDYYVKEVSGYSNIRIDSFCTTIEVKSHTATGISREGRSLFVQYGNQKKNVTEQSNKQKYTLINFLSNTLNFSGEKNFKKNVPYVTNIIWLTGINYDDFDRSIGLTGANIITSDVIIDEIFEIIASKGKLRNNGVLDSFKRSPDEIQRIANIFCAKNEGADTMSLRRMNILLQENFLLDDIDQQDGSVIVLSGHAGTGKTMMLLQAALNQANKGNRCLFLTYNIALISDLQRTMTFMPNIVKKIEMKSMHSFMISLLIRNSLWDETKSINKDFMPQINVLNKKGSNIVTVNDHYDFVFVDEAQDWEYPLPDVLKSAVLGAKLVIADGVDQFMASSEQSYWGKPLGDIMKKSLRQRRNLTIFCQIFANKLGVSWNVEPNDELPGGKVLIYSGYEPEIHHKLLDDQKSHGCTDYDLMLLASNSLIDDQGKFSKRVFYQQHNMPIYDGIDNEIKKTPYGIENVNKKQCRIYTYESCRGLEAWTTVCLRFHELFTKPHPHDYKEIDYTLARKYMLTLWALIPLTRAIDTLVIVVDPNTDIGEILIEIAEENPDFVTIKI